MGSLRWGSWSGGTPKPPVLLEWRWYHQLYHASAHFVLLIFLALRSVPTSLSQLWHVRSLPNVRGFMKNLKMLLGKIDQKVLGGSRGRVWNGEYQRQAVRGGGNMPRFPWSWVSLGLVTLELLALWERSSSICVIFWKSAKFPFS